MHFFVVNVDVVFALVDTFYCFGRDTAVVVLGFGTASEVVGISATEAVSKEVTIYPLRNTLSHGNPHLRATDIRQAKLSHSVDVVWIVQNF